MLILIRYSTSQVSTIKEIPNVVRNITFFTKGEAEHRIYGEAPTDPKIAVISADFEKGRHEYFPFPFDVTKMNPNIKSYGAWASADSATAAE